MSSRRQRSSARPASEHRTDSSLQGDQHSRATGDGLVYSDHREYVPGDDTRRIDWRLYARTGDLYVTQYEEERNLTVHVLIDASASMDYGDGDAHKFDYGAKLGLGFAYLFGQEHNDFRVSVFGDDVSRLDTGPSNRGEVLALVDRCNDIDPDGETDFADALAAYAGRIDSRSLVLVVSDFLADPDAVEDGLAALADNRLVLAHLLAPDERDPGVIGDAVFRDPETTETRRTYFGGRHAAAYRERLDGHVATVADVGTDLRATHARVDTGRQFFDAFADLWRDALAGGW
ncbi:DUF58 domain-containing protein [Halarchaeum sp. P4]|uniref:DUF58 domain-containing protein n=1 Tax=Halarchaeum sp. P4 TaxID=3421639 RepID=UPI003EB97060